MTFTMKKKARVVMTSAVKGDLSCFKSYTRTPEQFSVECQKTKTKAITLTNHKRGSHCNEPIKTQSKYMKP